MNRLIPLIVILAAGLSLPVQAQNVRLVHPLGSDDGNTCISTPCRTIERAVEVAVSGDIVDIAAGEYTEMLTIDKSLTLQGAGQDSVTIVQAHEEPGEADGRVLTITQDAVEVEIVDLTIRHGRVPSGCLGLPDLCQGGGLRNDGGELMLSKVTFRDNRAGAGGGLYNTSEATAVLAGVDFVDNRAGGSGGGMANVGDSTASMEDVQFLDNEAGSGGGLFNGSGAYAGLNNAIFSGNQARIQGIEGTGTGGGMRNLGSADLTDVDFINNAVNRRGGGLFNSLPGVICCSVEQVDRDIAGEDKETLTLAGVTFDDNSAQQGGGMYNDEERAPVLNGVTFSNNRAIAGGGIDSVGDPAFLGDFTILRGGGMYNEDGAPTLNNVTFTDNSAAFAGGGMFNGNGSVPMLTEVTFGDNTAQQAGGGMNNEGSSPVLVNGVFRGNASQAGGGMRNLESTPFLTNVVFSGNIATAFACGPTPCNGDGGGMHNDESAPRLTNVTFSGNRAAGTNGAGGGMFNVNDTSPIDVPVIRNTIFWNNMDDSGIGTASASIATGGAASAPNILFSLVQGAFPAGNGNLDGTDPANDPLFLNTPDPESAPTLAGNLRLRPESPAIDAGNNAFVDGIDTDLAGNPRIIGPAVDLGPYEFTGEIDDVIFRDRFETP